MYCTNKKEEQQKLCVFICSDNSGYIPVLWNIIGHMTNKLNIRLLTYILCPKLE